MSRAVSYGRFVKIEHTLFSFPLLLSGALLAQGELSLRTLLLILAAGTGARTAALGLNRILDRRIDRENPRTENRAWALPQPASRSSSPPPMAFPRNVSSWRRFLSPFSSRTRS